MQKNNFKIANRKIGKGSPVFIIAEVSANHNQSMDRAKKIIEAAAKAGADAVKVQTYKPETLTIDCVKRPFVIKSYNKNWDGKTLYDLYNSSYMPWEWQPELKKFAEQLGLVFFSTAYDETSVDFLEKMNVPAYKVASFELTDVVLLSKVAKTKKPVIISRGMGSIKEINNAVSVLKKNGARGIVVLHCVSSYPANPEDMDLATIQDIEKRFKVVSGLSDHTMGTLAATTSVALGACIIEKHLTLSRSEGGADSSFSMEPEEFKELVKSVRETEKLIGKVRYSPVKNELSELKGRRSLFAVEDIKKGEYFTKENVRIIRPNFGLAPEFFYKVVGKKAKKDIERGTPLKWDLIK
jgi:pseudaminic acid synthase